MKGMCVRVCISNKVTIIVLCHQAQSGVGFFELCEPEFDGQEALWLLERWVQRIEVNLQQAVQICFEANCRQEACTCSFRAIVNHGTCRVEVQYSFACHLMHRVLHLRRDLPANEILLNYTMLCTHFPRQLHLVNLTKRSRKVE